MDPGTSSLLQDVSTKSFVQVPISDERLLVVPICHHIISLLVEYGMLGEFRGTIIEVNVEDPAV